MRKIKIFKLLSKFFSKGHKRTVLAKKNIAASFIIKGINISIGLILVPLTIGYLNPTKYGIWITLGSVISWFGFFDIGLGNGLRNRFAESLAKGEKELARIYLSTTYAIISIIMGGVLVIFYFINPFLNWSRILNAGNDIHLKNELSLLALVIFTFFCLGFIFKLITTVLTADQRPAKASVFDLIAKVSALALVFILTKTTKGSLLYLGIALSSSPVIVLLLSNFWFYNGRYKEFRPSLKYVDFGKARYLFNLGIKFFIIQVASVLLYGTNNIVISQLFGPAEVTPYNVAFRYFSVLMMGFSIIISPFWSAFTEAWVNRELSWIKKTVSKLVHIWAFVAITGIVMLVFSNRIYHFWIGDKVKIMYSMSALVCAWVILNTWNGIYSTFLNGLGKIKLQLYLSIFASILNVPLSIFLGLKIGIGGVLLANVILGLIGAMIYPLQYKKLLNNSAKGIWNK